MRMETTIDQKTIQAALEAYLARNVGGSNQAALELVAGRGEKGFSATLTYDEGVIVQAIKNHMGQIFNADFRMEVDLAATRGPQGITAIIVVTDEDEDNAEQTKTEIVETVQQDDPPFEPDNQVEEEKAIDAEPNDEQPVRKGLFAHLKKPDNSDSAED